MGLVPVQTCPTVLRAGSDNPRAQPLHLPECELRASKRTRSVRLDRPAGRHGLVVLDKFDAKSDGSRVAAKPSGFWGSPSAWLVHFRLRSITAQRRERTLRLPTLVASRVATRAKVTVRACDRSRRSLRQKPGRA